MTPDEFQTADGVAKKGEKDFYSTADVREAVHPRGADAFHNRDEGYIAVVEDVEYTGAGERIPSRGRPLGQRIRNGSVTFHVALYEHAIDPRSRGGMTLDEEPFETRTFAGFDSFKEFRSGTHLVFRKRDGSYEPFHPDR